MTAEDRKQYHHKRPLMIIISIVLLVIILSCLSFCFLRLYLLDPDVTDLYGSAMLTLSIPAFALISFFKVLTIDIAILWIQGRGKMLLLLQGVWYDIDLMV